MRNNLQKNSAQGLMITNVPIAREGETIAEVEKSLLEKIEQLSTVQYVYILNNKDQLIGVISIKEVFRSPKSKKVSELMAREIHAAHPTTDREHIIRTSLKYSIKQVPVIDHDKKFLGVVTSDVILSGIQEEHSMDVMYSIGIHAPKDEQYGVISGSVYKNIKKRLPWLIVGIFGGFFAATVINYYKGLVGEEILIAAFIPAIAYISDSVGNQTQTLYIRTLAVRGEVDNFLYATKELIVVSGIGLVLGFISFLGVSLFYKNTSVAVVIGFSIFFTTIIASSIALIMPTFFKRMNFDPAIASGPFATILRDISSLLVYFAIANILLAEI